MKRYIFSIIALLFGLSHSVADNISVPDMNLVPGETATVGISLENTATNLVSFQMDLTLPEGITINKAGCSLSSRFTDEDQELTIGKQGDNVYRLTSTSFALTPISGTSGEIITLSLSASATSTGGTATLSNIRFVTSQSERIMLDGASFNIAVGTPSPVITFADANVKAICVANWDTNGDGELSEDEAAAVTSLGGVFETSRIITSFDELQYFTGLTEISTCAFRFCTDLHSIILPKNVRVIKDCAFEQCQSLASILFPANIEILSESAFNNCISLTSVTIPKTITEIGWNPFNGCKGLTSIVVDDENPNYDSRNNCNAIMETATNKLISGCKNTIIPEETVEIGLYAFFGVDFNYVPFSENITTIRHSAFSFSKGSALTIPANVTTIESSAFEGCIELTSITVDENNPVYDSRENCNALIATSSNTLITGCINTIIPNSVERIDSWAFTGDILSSVILPAGIISIEGSPFGAGANLESVTVKRTEPISISSATFPSRSNTTLYVPAGCKGAYQAADYWREFKEIIEMPSAIEFADANVKALCVANWDGNGDGELSVDEAAAVTSLGLVFKGNTEITSFDELQYFTGLTEIPRQAFMSCSNLTSVVIPDNITQIGYSAFDDCYALASINLPSTITNIDGAAFSDCRSLTSITLPEGIPTIGDWFFDNCTGLTEIVIPSSVTTIGQSAFSGCYNLQSVMLPEGLTSIGRSAFMHCNAFTSVIIPASVTTIENSAFAQCPNVTSIVVAEGNEKYDSRNNCNAIIETASNKVVAGCKNTVIPESVTTIGDRAFYYCTQLTSIVIPEGVTTIEESAFRSCTALTEITIPASVTSIGSYAFEECTSLTSVTALMQTPVAITSDVFSNRTNATLTVPFPTKYLYEAADYWKEFREIVQMEGPVAVGDTFPAPVPCGDATTDLTFKVTNVSPLEVEVMSSPEDIAGALTIPATVIYNGLQFAVKGIGEETFMDRALTSVQLPSGLEIIRSKAFYHSGLESIKFPSTLKEVYNNAFGECTSLQSIDFNHCSAFFSYQCFIACRALEEVNIPNTVKFRNGDGTWSWGTFEHCTSLKNVIFEPFEDEQTQWTSTTFFSNCSALETVVLPSNSVMQKAFFNNCTALRSVTYLELQDDFNPQTSSFDKMYNGLNPNLIQFTVPEGKAELMLKAGYLLLSDLSGLPLVREQFEDEANRIATMAEGFANGDKQTLATAISNARLAVNAAEDYSIVYEQIDGIKSAAMAFIKTATIGNEIDVTSAYVVNPDFNRLQLKWNSTGDWTTWPNVHKRGWSEDHYDNGDVTVDKFFEIWEGSNSLADNSISQTIKDLPAGNYRLEADIITTNQSDANAEVTGVYLFANSSKTAVATENEKPQHFSVEFTHYKDADCVIGVDVNSTNANWVAMDNVRLYRLIGDVPAPVVDEEGTYYIQNVETGQYLGKGNAWGTHTVLKDEGLPVKVTLLPDGSYTIYFLEGSWNQQLMFRASESGVFVDYNNNSNSCPYWTITTTSNEGEYRIQSLVTDPLYGQQVYPGTFLGNNPTKEAFNQDGNALGVYNDIDGNVLDEEGMNITWRFVSRDAYNAKELKDDLRKFIDYARAAGTDVSAAEAVANNVNASSEEVTAAIGELRTAYLSKLNEGVSEELLPLDVSGLIVNAGFDHNDSHGWTNSETEGTGGKSVRAGEQAYEFWNTAFDFHQTLSGLPNGNYLLKMKGFHRTETYEGTTQKSQYGEPTAVLYANGENQVLRSILDGMTQGNLGDDWPVDDEGTTYYVPKNMAGVAARFERDMYWNEVPVTVTDGELTIGVKLDNYTNSCWVMFDEFRLILLEPEEQSVVINVTDVSQLDNAIYMNPVTTIAGAKGVTLPIRLKNKEMAKGYQFDLELPEGVSVSTTSSGVAISLVSDRHNGHSLMNSSPAANTYRVLVFSASGTSLSGNDGVVVNVSVDVSSGLSQGEYAVNIKNVSLSISGEGSLDQDIELVPTVSKVVLAEGILGDVNHDGRVTIADVTSLVNIILGTSASSDNNKADVNGDGRVTIADVTSLVNIILGKQ